MLLFKKTSGKICGLKYSLNVGQPRCPNHFRGFFVNQKMETQSQQPLKAILASDNNEKKEEQKSEIELSFVKRNPGLKQLFKKNAKGFYPRKPVKAIPDMLAEDVEQLAAGASDEYLTEIMKKLIMREQGLDEKMQIALLTQLYDRDIELTEQLYMRLLNSRTSRSNSPNSSPSQHNTTTNNNTFMTGLHYNLMLASAAKFQNPQLLDQLLLESTVLGIPLDSQTYIKICRSKVLQTKNNCSNSSGQVETFTESDSLNRLIEEDLTDQDLEFVNELSNSAATTTTRSRAGNTYQKSSKFFSIQSEDLDHEIGLGSVQHRRYSQDATPTDPTDLMKIKINSSRISLGSSDIQAVTSPNTRSNNLTVSGAASEAMRTTSTAPQAQYNSRMSSAQSVSSRQEKTNEIRTQRPQTSALEGCCFMMADSMVEDASTSCDTDEYESDDEEFLMEFQPFGQLDEIVREALLKFEAQS